MCLDQYFEILEEESKEHGLNKGVVNHAYCYGVVKTHLEWALQGDYQKEIVMKNIQETVNEYAKQLELNI